MTTYREEEYLEASTPGLPVDQFALEDEILYLCKKKTNGTILYLLVVPHGLRKAAMQYIHEKETGHMGQHKTILKAEEYFYWPNLKKEVKQFVKECITCQQFKNTPRTATTVARATACNPAHGADQHRRNRHGWRSSRTEIRPDGD